MIENLIPDVIAAPRTIGEMTEFIEGLLPVYPKAGTSSYAPTGERYITFTIAGQLDEGEPTVLIATREAGACKWFLDSFLRYAIDKRGTLYWREKPHLKSREFIPVDDAGKAIPEDRTVYFTIWARLLVSDKPVMESK